MDTRNGVRQRRQERIRQILEQQQTLTLPKAAAEQDRSYQAPVHGVQPSSIPGHKPAGMPPVSGSMERDPERDWKERANPWENAGWNMTAKLHPAGGKASDRGGGREGRGGKGGSPFIRGIYIQTVISAILFVIVFAMYKLEHPIAKKGQQIVTAALTDTMDFQAAAEWYEATFAGAPSFIPIFGSHAPKQAEVVEGGIELPTMAPLKNGTVVRTFAETLSGVDLAGESNDEVVASETGRVLLVTEDEKTGKTIVIQHANQRETVYGMLGETQVVLSDWVEAGHPIGKLKAASEGETSLLFFAVKEKGRFVNPADVFPLD
ncbi:M23 family metallopeptidase [Paenibacillus spongiae]|uniref:M23 family metallopeptidase n=1 Tax=Paenibacillus spongiae TaxID=2909671 RepID=A0ABY5S2L1_9BACL|nr:M23 family metallopeptidase [Paenibacillus spongiae]UVI28116.1 M23 family metallopeptidase [Paenibacillus spongiae]